MVRTYERIRKQKLYARPYNEVTHSRYGGYCIMKLITEKQFVSETETDEFVRCRIIKKKGGAL
jgi:hypothetical protein